MATIATAAAPVCGSAAGATPPDAGLWPRLGRLRPAPVLVVALMLALAAGPWLAIVHGNPTGFIRFGHAYVTVTHPPAGAVVSSRTGYDGQYFWALANDPLLLQDRTVSDFQGAGFRLQRVAYPALAYAFAAGQRGALPWSLLAINVIAVLGITAGFARWAARRGISPWWALAVGLLPGFVVATVGDMSDVIATGAMLGGLMLWQGGRRWPAAGLLALATLAREPMILAAGAVAVEVAIDAWRSRGRAGAARAAVRRALPVVAVPAIAFLTWQVYLHLRFSGAIAAPGTAYQLPFAGLLAEARRALGDGRVLSDGWDLAYLTLMVAGIGLALALLRRGPSASAVAAALFGVSLLVLTFGSDWSYTRLSAPMFATLLLAGLERRARPALVVCAAVAALGAVSPLVLG